jgi:hypothetical protein
VKPNDTHATTRVFLTSATVSRSLSSDRVLLMEADGLTRDELCEDRCVIGGKLRYMLLWLSSRAWGGPRQGTRRKYIYLLPKYERVETPNTTTIGRMFETCRRIHFLESEPWRDDRQAWMEWKEYENEKSNKQSLKKGGRKTARE